MFFPKVTTAFQKIVFIASCAASLVLLTSFMHEFAVDLLMADRIDTWNSLFKNVSLLEGFTAQHGPHRVGFLFIFSKIGYLLGNSFDTRYDLFINAAVIWSTIPLGSWVKFKITDKFNWYDVIVPFIIGGTWQWATLILNPHIHVMLPLFTLLFTALLISKFRDNLILNMLLVFTATFSVYAIFAALLFVIFQSIKWIIEKKWVHLAVVLLFAIATLLLYFQDFRIATLSSAGQFNVFQILKAPVLILSFFIYVPNWVGLLIVLGLAGLTVHFFKDFDFSKPKKVATLFMLGSAISFVFFQSIGRSGDNPIVFSAFRYYTELVLFIWSTAIVASFYKSKFIALFVLVGFSWIATQPNNPKRGDWIEYTQNMKHLKDCVLETHDLETCNRDLNLQIHANPSKSKVVEKWLMLEQRKQDFQEVK